MVSEMGKPLVLAFNKIDLLTKKQKDNLYETKKVQSNFVENFLKLKSLVSKEKVSKSYSK